VRETRDARMASIDRGFAAGCVRVDPEVDRGGRVPRGREGAAVPLAGTPLACVPWHEAQFCWKSASPSVTNAAEGRGR